MAGQYLLEWESSRYPEGGTYLGPVDFVFNGPDRQFLSAALGFAARGAAAEPPQHGEFGLATRWTPQWLDGTVGFYYRNYADKLPQVLLTKVGPASASQYNLIYADNIQLFGASIAKNIGGVSASAELSYRKNTPLNAQVLGIAPGLPEQGDTKGPRGNTWHGLANAIGTIAKTPTFDAATWAVELNFMHLDSVTSGANLFNGVGYAPCVGKDKWDGCATRNYVGIGGSFSPTWFQVFPGVDLSAPMTYAIGLSGNAATTFGGNESLGNYSVGIGADVQQKYRFDLKYIDFFGHYRDNGTVVTSTNGLTAFLPDRGFVVLPSRPPSEESTMNRKLHWFAALLAVLGHRRLRRRLRRRGQAARHDADRGRRREGRQRGRHHPRVHRRPDDARRPASRPATASAPIRSRREKPRLAITAKNMAHVRGDKLTEGTKELLKKYPTMRVDVYPTHRTVAFPKCVLDNTAEERDSRAKTLNDGRSIEGALAGFPFPIPKTGYEAMWNHLLRYNGLAYEAKYRNLNVDAAGAPTLATEGAAPQEYPVLRPEAATARSRRRPTGASSSTYTGPARRAGEALLIVDPVDIR